MLNRYSDTLLFGKGLAKIEAKDLILPIDLGDRVDYIEQGTVIASLMSIDEIKRYEGLPLEAQRQVSDAIMTEKIVEIVGHTGKRLDFNFGPAGLSSFLLNALYAKSLQYVSNTVPEFALALENVTLYDQMAAVISNRLTIPFTEVILYPVNEVVRLYAICFKSFPDVVDLRPKDELEDADDV